jgi:hypothetical protein
VFVTAPGWPAASACLHSNDLPRTLVLRYLPEYETPQRATRAGSQRPWAEPGSVAKSSAVCQSCDVARATSGREWGDGEGIADTYGVALTERESAAQCCCCWM